MLPQDLFFGFFCDWAQVNTHDRYRVELSTVSDKSVVIGWLSSSNLGTTSLLVMSLPISITTLLIGRARQTSTGKTLFTSFDSTCTKDTGQGVYCIPTPWIITLTMTANGSTLFRDWNAQVSLTMVTFCWSLGSPVRDTEPTKVKGLKKAGLHCYSWLVVWFW